MNKQKQFIPCDCPKGGVYSDGQVCQKCGGTEYIEQKQSWEERFDNLISVSSDKPKYTRLGESVKKFISQEIQKAYQKGIVDAVKELDELGYNKEAEKKAREEKKNKFKKRIEHIAMELDNEPSEGEESVYSWIEGQFPELFNKE